MKKKLSTQTQIKQKMAAETAEIIQHLHNGKRKQADKMIKLLKNQSLDFESPIQQDVLMFAEQVQFQYDYDPWHKVTPEVKRAADKLLKDLDLP